MDKLIYYFGNKAAEGDASMKDILGGKGANLAQMSKMGLPIPPGFTISTELCISNINKEKNFTPKFEKELKSYIKRLEQDTKKEFGSLENPLLLSVRSGAKISMPGMMDTILNLGMNDEVAKALAKRTNNPRFAYDSYRRFLEMYGNVVLEIPGYLFEDVFNRHKEKNDIVKDSDLTAEILKEIVIDFKNIIAKKTNREFELDPYEQLKSAILAVWRSWNSPRALTYRSINNISDDMGTAVNVQSMVFGNKGTDSATGVIFTRDPSNGKNNIFGEFLINAQGEDVVAGVRTPSAISSDGSGNSMEECMNKQYNDLVAVCFQLEQHFRDMQDIEFTIEEGNLYILQTRSGKRTAAAAIKIAVDMVKEGIISKEDALMRIDPESLNQLLHTAIDYLANPKIIAKGLPASPGAGAGIAVFSPHDVEELSHHHKVILVRNDTSPEDIKGMYLAQGILTARGGMTSHAAVVARGMGKPCVCGVGGLVVNEKEKFFITSSGHRVNQGDQITIDGSSGGIIIGDVKLIQPEFSDEFKIILEWSDEIKDLDVRANAETVLDASVAIKFGAVGIGLCRTEHMFFDDEKIPLVREMIIAENIDHKQKAIDKLKPLQIKDFKDLFRVMNGRPVNVRLLDPPLHEFLPTAQKEKERLAASLGLTLSAIEDRLNSLHEFNPMLGHRGCRLGISNPEIYIMQVEAMLHAIKELKYEQDIDTKLELMIPFISNVNELTKLKNYITDIISQMESDHSIKFNIKLGTMIELPRAALTANKLAEHVEYFSFGSNDLTQTTYGISRDDIGLFLPNYLDKKIFEHDPFIKIDQEGVGELVKIAIERGRKSNHSLKLGVCGEHAGEPSSIEFFHKIGLDYISCSPYRIPIARVAAAKSKIKSSRIR
jgi:pyruvate, orthophosphate dikinase